MASAVVESQDLISINAQALARTLWLSLRACRSLPPLLSLDAAEMRKVIQPLRDGDSGGRVSLPRWSVFLGATNTSRESTMYPKAVQDLCGWRTVEPSCWHVTVSPALDVCLCLMQGRFLDGALSEAPLFHYVVCPGFQSLEGRDSAQSRGVGRSLTGGCAFPAAAESH